MKKMFFGFVMVVMGWGSPHGGGAQDVSVSLSQPPSPQQKELGQMVPLPQRAGETPSQQNFPLHSPAINAVTPPLLPQQSPPPQGGIQPLPPNLDEGPSAPGPQVQVPVQTQPQAQAHPHPHPQVQGTTQAPLQGQWQIPLHPQALSQKVSLEDLPHPAKGAMVSADIQGILNRGELVVAMCITDQPPFFMQDKDGKLIGLDIELARKMAEALGVSVRFDRTAKSFNEVIDIVALGKADIGISKLSYTLDRAKKVLYSKPYISLKKMFLINRLMLTKARGKRGADTLEKLMDTPNSTIGIVSNSSYEHFAELLFPKAHLIQLDSWGLNSLKLAAEGKILTIFRDDLEILKLMRQAPDSNFHVLPVTLKDQKDPIHMVLPWDKVHFLEWVNGFLDTLKLTLTVDDLLDTYEDYFNWLYKVNTQEENRRG